MNIIDWTAQNLGSLWVIGSSIITIASIIVKLTPTKKDDHWLQKTISLLSMISLNKPTPSGSVRVRRGKK